MPDLCRKPYMQPHAQNPYQTCPAPHDAGHNKYADVANSQMAPQLFQFFLAPTGSGSVSDSVRWQNHGCIFWYQMSYGTHLDNSFRHLVPKDAPMVLQEMFLKHAGKFLKYVKGTVIAVSADRKGKIEEVVLQTTKWNFLLHHVLFGYEEHYQARLKLIHDHHVSFKEKAVAYET